MIKLAAPMGPVVGKIMGFPPSFRELISASDGVTYWAKDDKARRELGYAPHDLDTGIRQTLDSATRAGRSGRAARDRRPHAVARFAD